MMAGWEIKKLGDVCELYQPKTISSKEMVDDGAYPVFGANGIIGKYDKYNHEEPQLLITCRGATCGSVNVTEPKSWINGNAMVVRPIDNSLLLKFVEYLFRGGIDISKTITGAAQPQITRQTLSPILITYPQALSEQQRIVSILDEAFAAIASAKANAEQNLKNAKELFESYLQGVFENKGEGWEEKPLGELATFRNGINYTKSSKGDKVKIVGVKDFQNSFWVPFESLESVILDGQLSEVDLLNEGDIITVRSNGNPQLIGRTLLANKVVEKTSHSGFTIRIRLNTKNIIDPIYLCNFLKIPETRKILVDGGNGVGIKSLNQGSLSALVIRFPRTLKEQQTVVQNIDDFSTETKRLEAIYQQKIADIDELKKSILQKAFSGELKMSEPLIAADEDDTTDSKKSPSTINQSTKSKKSTKSTVQTINNQSTKSKKSTKSTVQTIN
jgi:type I restriction enzyme, S subunit